MNNELKHNSFNIWAFRAIDQMELCKEYIKGHIKVLADYGISSITSNNSLWIENANMYCVVAKDSITQELLGGIRIQIADEFKTAFFDIFSNALPFPQFLRALTTSQFLDTIKPALAIAFKSKIAKSTKNKIIKIPVRPSS